jgi:putative acetyltransferase
VASGPRRCMADYRVEQTEAWLPSPPSAAAMHDRATDGRSVFVATLGAHGVVGYIDLEADEHIDHLDCTPEAVGSEVAGALYDALEGRARELGLAQLRVEASESARRFFEKSDFTMQGRRDWELRSVPIHNYSIRKWCSGRHQGHRAPHRDSYPSRSLERASRVNRPTCRFLKKAQLSAVVFACPHSTAPDHSRPSVMAR